MKKTLSLIFVIAAVIVVLNAPFMKTVNAEEESGTKITTLSAEKLEKGKQFVFKGMPWNSSKCPVRYLNGKKLKLHTIQNFAFTPDNKYIFATSEATEGNNRHTILSRCTMPSKFKATAKSKFIEGKILQNFGHGETIAITQQNPNKETYYIWVATRPQYGFSGVQIARLTYVIENGVGTITKVARIANFKWTLIKKKKPSLYKDAPYATRVNVSIDADNNQIAFRHELSNGKINYVIYDLKKVNAALNKLENGKSIEVKKLYKMQLLNIRMQATPCKDFQSFAICDNTLYVAGGNTGKGAKIYTVRYSPFKPGKSRLVTFPKARLDRVMAISTYLVVDGETLGRDELEIEGLMVKKDKSGKPYMYINFFQDGIGIKNSIGVYRFSADETE